jgi:hypothetical protein
MAVVLPGSFVYLAHPSTGSTATTTALLKIEGAFMPLDRRKTFGHHATMTQALSVCEDQLTGREVIFTAVRNPYDAIASWFVLNRDHFQMRHLEEVLQRAPRIKDFLDIWLQMDAMPKMGAVPWLRDGRMFYHVGAARLFIHQERLQLDLDAVIRKVPDSPGRVQLHRENPTEGKDHWTAYYTDADYAYVNEKFGREIVKFGYPFVWSNESLA